MLMNENEGSSSQQADSQEIGGQGVNVPVAPETAGVDTIATPTAMPELPKKIVVAELFNVGQILSLVDLLGTTQSFKVVNNAGSCLTLKLIQEAI